MLIWPLIIFVMVTGFCRANKPGVCEKVSFYTKSVVKTHTVMKRFTSRKWNGNIVVKFTPVVEHYTDTEYLTKTIDVCCAGYTLLRGKCIPLCDRVCENSKCTAPNVCTCLDGYEKFNDFRCVPHCDRCVHGFCSAPNICDCYRGYERDGNNVCRPKCEQPCQNGICSLPDTCTCLPGHRLTVNSTYNCQPVCDPPCNERIKGSECVAPDVCKCSEGYEFEPDLGECVPICSNCTNGHCIAPEECECWDGYKLNNSGICSPFCEKTCQNGYCTAPHQCTCDPGYELDENDHYRCLPICSNCANGECTAPNECTCWNGYESDVNGTCSPICSQPCKNSFCSEPDNCTCFEGYEMSPNDSFSCLPICEGCNYGNCIEPGNCSCWQMYNWDSSSNECVFIATTTGEQPGELLNQNTTDFDQQPAKDLCDPPCINGVCTQGQCLCYSGYISSDESNECISDCEKSCINGFCNADNTCVCSEGHTLINGTECVSPCAVECVNGYCIEPDLCECWEGYILDYNQTTTNYCIPLCDNEEDGCINGTCISPDVCECFEGFELSSSNKFVCLPQSAVSEAIASTRSVWPFILCAIAIIAASVGLLYYIIQNKFGEKGYNVDKKEKSKGVVSYNTERDHVAVI